MADEQHYESHLLSFDEALKHISGGERKVLQYAWEVYCFTCTELEKQRLDAEETGDYYFIRADNNISDLFSTFRSRSF